MVHGVLVSQGPFLPSFVYVGLFVFTLGGGTLAFRYDRPTPATAGILEIGPRSARVPATLPAKFGLPRPFRFFSRWRHGTDRRTDGQHRYIMGPPSRKDGPIISFAKLNWKVYSVYSGVVALARKKPEGGRSPYTDSPKLKGKRKKTAPPQKKKLGYREIVEKS